MCITYVVIGDTVVNNSITVRLSPNDIKMIDRKIVEGYFTSRSDIIRYSIRRTIQDLESREQRLEELARLVQDKNISIKDIKKALKTAHKNTYRDMYGQD